MDKTFKSGFVTVVGRSNVGKSTLLNYIMGEKLVITANKPQTTRNAIRLIYTDDSCQLVFIDTPGMHKPKTKLGEYMEKAAENTLNDVDVIVFMMEPDKYLGPGDKEILERLAKTKTPVIAVINKIDTVAKEDLLATIAALQPYDFIAEIIPITAAGGDGVKELMAAIKDKLEEGPMYFPDDMIVDQSERFIVAEIIREKVLRLLKEEVPHGVAVEVMSMKARTGKNLIDIEATIFCEKKSHKGIVIGKGGAMLKKIGQQARTDIEFFLKSPVNLQLWVKIRPDWREKNFDLKDLGYSD